MNHYVTSIVKIKFSYKDKLTKSITRANSKFKFKGKFKNQVQLKKLRALPAEEVRSELIQLKGIGHWTIDVYLMHALQRTDLFPLGDIALVNSLKEIKQLHPHISKEEMLKIAEPWRPYRTIAAMILWHSYIKKRNIKLRD